MYIQSAKRPQRTCETQLGVVMDGGLEIIPGYDVVWALCRKKHELT